MEVDDANRRAADDKAVMEAIFEWAAEHRREDLLMELSHLMDFRVERDSSPRMILATIQSLLERNVPALSMLLSLVHLLQGRLASICERNVRKSPSLYPLYEKFLLAINEKVMVSAWGKQDKGLALINKLYNNINDIETITPNLCKKLEVQKTFYLSMLSSEDWLQPIDLDTQAEVDGKLMQCLRAYSAEASRILGPCVLDRVSQQ
eukprot:m.49707 g.49707  ORF g.49707 m.49707 type:complete len:206 (+) comp12847_c0_seq2:140-757(+)